MDNYLSNISSLSLDKIQNENLKTKMDSLKDKQLMKACKSYEAMFFKMMFDEMIKTTSLSKSFGKGAGGEFFKDMFLHDLSENVAGGSNSSGLAKMIYDQIQQGRNPHKNQSPASDIQQKKTPLREINKDDILREMPFKELTNLRSRISGTLKYNDLIEEISEKEEVDSALVKAIVKNESAGNYRAVSKAGAKGLMQLMDSTAEEMGVSDSFDPKQNINGGVKYLKKLLKTFDNDYELSLAAYNSGIGTVKKYGGIPPYGETENYVKKVLADYQEFKK